MVFSHHHYQGLLPPFQITLHSNLLNLMPYNSQLLKYKFVFSNLSPPKFYLVFLFSLLQLFKKHLFLCPIIKTNQDNYIWRFLLCYQQDLLISSQILFFHKFGIGMGLKYLLSIRLIFEGGYWRFDFLFSCLFVGLILK